MRWRKETTRMATEREIERKIIENAGQMARILVKGKDCELRKSASGVSIAEVSKKVVAR